MKKKNLIFLGILAVAAVLAGWSADSLAYERYIDGCNTCHGNFTSTKVDQHGSTWPGNLHNVHRNSMLNGVCEACHLGASESSQNAYTFKSTGNASLPGVGCVGCHGNNYNGVILGAGLRKHHAGAGVTECAGCHSVDPTAKPENNKPPYYGKAGVNVKDPLNADGSENWSDDGQGLDNDGNGLYDQNDPAASVLAVTAPAAAEAVPTGATYAITWTAKAGASSYTIKLSVDNGLTWSSIASGVPGTSTNWGVPSTFKKNITKAIIKVIALDASKNKIGVAKSGTFTIDVLTITAPVAGDTVPQNAPYPITWNTNGTVAPPASVIVKYTLNNGTTWKAAQGAGTTAGFTWDAPVVAARKNAKLKVILKDAAGATVANAVSGTFIIQ